MKALVSLNENNIEYTSSWTNYVDPDDGTTRQIGVVSILPNAARIVQIQENQFDVHSDLIWVECNTSVNVKDYYYDKSDSTIKLIPHVSQPS